MEDAEFYENCFLYSDSINSESSINGNLFFQVIEYVTYLCDM